MPGTCIHVSLTRCSQLCYCIPRTPLVSLAGWSRQLSRWSIADFEHSGMSSFTLQCRLAERRSSSMPKSGALCGVGHVCRIAFFVAHMISWGMVQNDAGGQGSGSWQRWEQVKLLRAEWSRPKTVHQLFSRVLYISNLKPVSSSQHSWQGQADMATWSCITLRIVSPPLLTDGRQLLDMPQVVLCYSAPATSSAENRSALSKHLQASG